MGCFGLRMIWAWSTTITHSTNVADDKKWEILKRQKCHQGTTKCQQQ
jgi:hypothetical protein